MAGIRARPEKGSLPYFAQISIIEWAIDGRGDTFVLTPLVLLTNEIGNATNQLIEMLSHDKANVHLLPTFSTDIQVYVMHIFLIYRATYKKTIYIAKYLHFGFILYIPHTIHDGKYTLYCRCSYLYLFNTITIMFLSLL